MRDTMTMVLLILVSIAAINLFNGKADPAPQRVIAPVARDSTPSWLPPSDITPSRLARAPREDLINLAAGLTFYAAHCGNLPEKTELTVIALLDRYHDDVVFKMAFDLDKSHNKLGTRDFCSMLRTSFWSVL
jgi:hypothetical protein